MFDITDTLPVHIDPLMQLYARAFADEDLRPLVKDLLSLSPQVISLSALSNGAVVGHVVLTPSLNHPAALLGPLAVDPDHQRNGIGTALIKAGFARCKTDGLRKVCVLGDPAYYGRHGFVPETKLQTPCPIPDQWAGAWQSVALVQGDELSGVLDMPAPWMDDALWSDGS
ncbi:MAG: GNAT family N-acetyltransferase [Planktomarina sp.]